MKSALLALVIVAALTLAWEARAQHGAHQAEPSTKTVESGASKRVTMEELHRSGGVPRGWTFTLPAGDAGRGRQAFADLECYKCHSVQGAGFPDAGSGRQPGPELTGMGSHHPAEYFAQSIIDPNAVIIEGPGFTGPDGRSIMPSYADALSVKQLIDVVAYLKSLGSAEGGHAAHGATGARGPGAAREKSIGDYALRLVYAPATGGDHHEHAHHGAPRAAAGHLMAFVTDRESGEAVPYLPVTVTVHAAGTPPPVVRLVPMLGDQGFHYGADLTLPERVQKLLVSIGPTTIRVTGAAKGRFVKAVTAVIEW